MLENLRNYLQKHYNIKPTNRMIREEVCKAVLDVCGIRLQDSEVLVRGNQVYLQVRPVKRNEILLRHVEVLQELRKTANASGINMLR